MKKNCPTHAARHKEQRNTHRISFCCADVWKVLCVCVFVCTYSYPTYVCMSMYVLLAGTYLQLLGIHYVSTSIVSLKYYTYTYDVLNVRIWGRLGSSRVFSFARYLCVENDLFIVTLTFFEHRRTSYVAVTF